MQLAPAPGCTGIELLRADTFDLHCFQTLTGTKFLVVVEPDTPDVEALLRETCDPLLLRLRRTLLPSVAPNTV